MRQLGRQGTALLSILVLSLGLASGISFGETCGSASTCPMVTAGSKNHCQPSSAISAGCCANMSPVASQTTPTRAIAKPSMQVSLAGPDVTSFDSIESNDDRPAPIASKLHEIGRHTLFQVFLS